MVNFEVATREKYRFSFKGMISVEDLWDLDMDQLNTVFKTLNKGKKAAEEESLLEASQNKEEVILTNKIDIVKYIFEVKKNELQARRDAAVKHAKNERIKELIAKKQDESLASMSIEELQKLIEE